MEKQMREVQSETRGLLEENDANNMTPPETSNWEIPGTGPGKRSLELLKPSVPRQLWGNGFTLLLSGCTTSRLFLELVGTEIEQFMERGDLSGSRRNNSLIINKRGLLCPA
jgi:hypothetical protein